MMADASDATPPRSLPASPLVASLAARQDALEARLDDLEVLAEDAGVPASPLAGALRADPPAHPLPAGPPESSFVDVSSPVVRRLNDWMLRRGAVTPAVFVRVPAQYYDEDLHFRAACVASATAAARVDVAQLCKTICMENTKCTERTNADASNPRWILVLVQYTARLNQQKLDKFLHERANRAKAAAGLPPIPKSKFHARLARDEDSERITGYKSGGVTPFAAAEEAPVLVSDQIGIEGGEAWLGGGETDLKMRVRVEDAVRALGAEVVDCTY